eukprot:UN34066
MSVVERNSHFENCGFKLLTCRNPGCNKVLKKLNEKSHADKCEFALIPCIHEGCKDAVPRWSAERHKSQCKHALLPCTGLRQGCKDLIKRLNFNAHITSCPYVKLNELKAYEKLLKNLHKKSKIIVINIKINNETQKLSIYLDHCIKDYFGDHFNYHIFLQHQKNGLSQVIRNFLT